MQPLTGVRVLDLSRLLPGPFASLVLADMGASVDKVEDPDGGDYVRHFPPQLGGQSTIFLTLNRNKRSIVLDLKKDSAKRALLELVKKYDVLLEQFRPGVLTRLGLSHETLLAANPKLVVCALTGYGQTGPLAHRAGHDLNYLARSGVLGMQGPSDACPQPPGFQLADVSGGLYAVIQILGALRERDRTGKGAILDVAMVDASMGFAVAGFAMLYGGASLTRGGEALTGGIGPYNTYQTKDGGHVALAALEPKFWMVFCAAVGLEVDMGALMPGPHQADLKAKLAAIFAGKTRAEWESFSKEHDCCLEPVLTPEETLADAHLRARGAVFDLDTPFGKSTQLRLPVTPEGKAHAPPPRQGEHTDVILAEAGIDSALIDELRSTRGAVQT